MVKVVSKHERQPAETFELDGSWPLFENVCDLMQRGAVQCSAVCSLQ